MKSHLIIIKVGHTVIWTFYNVVIWYLLYAVIANKIDSLVWIGISLVFLEGFILFIFKNICPLTLIARKYSNSSKENFDIYLPNWLAKYNKQIYTSIFVIILCLLLYRLAS